MTRSEYLKVKKNARRINEMEKALAQAMMTGNKAAIEMAKRVLEAALNSSKAADFLA
jgi:hypothetical protein